MKQYLKLLTSLSIVFTSGCVKEDTTEAENIVRRSIEAHGGWEAWKNAEKIRYDKTIILYDSSGKVETRVKQDHVYQLKPQLKGEIHWKNESETNKIVYDGELAVREINGISDSSGSEEALSIFMAAHYVLFQPFKLLDPGVNLTYLEQDTLEDGVIADVILAEFDQNEDKNTDNDKWWFYFDISSDLLAANMVRHEGKYSYIRNLDYNTSNSLILNHHRKSYFTDSLRNIKYLRAEYFYENIVLE